ncbi:CPBP family intramembrane glutamic endopeptidase [Promicromonospora citrea]|uniref:CAAX amino protease n=1 Tax=Promicromonospora citrea TaxID=43677 RepID=A0A8H9GN78_9MICO|nr:CPBP family intramembrane glutamic endopeptidase [Promicromonospora citrea]NNH50977.1 CPBP family intramembrane metalloprotease [Promicromonospora citrea]GGM41136.1 CAAX amino protease [Promicromonospora citrea]
MRLVWQLVAVVAVSFLGGQALVLVQDDPWLTVVVGLATAVAGLALYAWVVRRTERRAVTELAADGAARSLGLGTLLGLGVFSAVIGIIAAFGGYTVHGLGTVPGALGLLGFMAGVAVTEELLWRGVLFRFAEGWLGTWAALALTGLLFGLAHLLNPHATLWGAIAIAIEAGGMLTAAYVATRRLWVPIGLHLGWNVAGSALFSTEVSGNDTPQGLLDAATSGNVLVTGGAFGPEGSVFSVLLCAATAVVFLVVAHRRGEIVPLRRSARAARDAARLPA